MIANFPILHCGRAKLSLFAIPNHQSPSPGGVAISIFKRLFGGRQAHADRSPAVALGAFGKHPAFDDHLEDSGLVSAALIDARRILYADAIRANIDSGTWERLAPEQRLEEFDHTLLWSLSARDHVLLMGRLLPSRDAKGREKYPFVLCAELHDPRAREAIRSTVDRLDTIAQECASVTSREQFAAVLEAAREEAPSVLTSPPHAAPTGALLTAITAPRAGKPGLESFARCLYALERELTPVPDRTTASGTGHVRLPAPGLTDADALAAWLAIIHLWLPTLPGVLLVKPRARPWLDVLVPIPLPAQLACIRCDTAVVPLACDVPYTLDARLRERTEELARRLMPATETHMPSFPVPVSPGRPGALPLLLVVAGASLLALAVVPAFAQAGAGGAPPAIIEQVDDLRAIERESRTAELLRIARASTGQPERLFAAWRRLSNRGEVLWPANQADLLDEVALRPALLAAAAAASTPERATQLRQEVDSEQVRRLTRLLSTTTDDGTLAAVDEAIRAFGLVEHTLDGRIRYNLLLSRLKRAAAAPGISDAEARSLARTFVTDIRKLSGGIAFLAGANSVVAAFDDIADGALAPTGATLMPCRLGPGAAGLGQGVRAGDTLRFDLPPRSGYPATTLEFVLVGEGETASFITVTEVSVGQVGAILAATDSERSMPALLPIVRPLEDVRPAPRSWVWTQDDFGVPQIRPAPTWLPPVAVLSGVDYPAGLEPMPPSLDSPMQHIPVVAASYIAAKAGCRFPTIGEWTALFNEHLGEAVQGANLRDSRWRTFQEHILARRAAGVWAEDADAGAFVPSGTRLDVGSVESAAHDDSWLWFAPIAPIAPGAGDVAVSHVIGNVAEFVTTEAWEPETDPGKTGKKVRAAMDQLRVIGGSALSHPSIDPRQPQALDRIDALGGFSDVGFRLAFGADHVTRPREQVGLQILEILTPTPYLRPR